MDHHPFLDGATHGSPTKNPGDFPATQVDLASTRVYPRHSQLTSPLAKPVLRPTTTVLWPTPMVLGGTQRCWGLPMPKMTPLLPLACETPGLVGPCHQLVPRWKVEVNPSNQENSLPYRLLFTSISVWFSNISSYHQPSLSSIHYYQLSIIGAKSR